MSWEDDCTVKLYGKSIPGSNIMDLVNDVIKHRKGSEPASWQAFAEGLRDMNIPQDVIGNRERWDWIHHAPKRLKRIISLPNKNAVLEKQQVTFPYLPGLQRV